MPRFDLAQLLRLVQDYGVTRLLAAPPIIVALAKQAIVDDYDLSTLRTVICGGAPLGADLATRCADRLGCTVRQTLWDDARPASHTCRPSIRIRPRSGRSVHALPAPNVR